MWGVLLAWALPGLFGLVMLVGLGETVREQLAAGRTRRELRCLAPAVARQRAERYVRGLFEAAIAGHQEKVTVKPAGYEEFAPDVGTVADVFHYYREASAKGSNTYAVRLPTPAAAVGDVEAENLRGQVWRDWGVDPFDERHRQYEGRRAGRCQRIINWWNGLAFMPAVICFCIALVGVGGGRYPRSPGELFVRTAPTFEFIVAVLAVVLGAPSLTAIIVYARRKKRHRRLGEGAYQEWGWNLLARWTHVQLPTNAGGAGPEAGPSPHAVPRDRRPPVTGSVPRHPSNAPKE